MKPSEIYRMAAVAKERNPQEYYGSCMHISKAADAAGALSEPLLSAYREMMAPKGHGCGDFWWDGADERVLALCFMAAIAEDEERAATKRRS